MHEMTWRALFMPWWHYGAVYAVLTALTALSFERAPVGAFQLGGFLMAMSMVVGLAFDRDDMLRSPAHPAVAAFATAILGPALFYGAAFAFGIAKLFTAFVLSLF